MKISYVYCITKKPYGFYQQTRKRDFIFKVRYIIIFYLSVFTENNNEQETEMSVYSMLMWKPLNEILLSTLVVLLSFNKCQVYTMFILFHFLLLLLVVVVGRRFYRFFMYCSITIFMQIILLYILQYISGIF